MNTNTQPKMESIIAEAINQGHLPKDFPMSDRKTFVCPISDCGKEYRFKSELDRHFAIHTKERPHVCTLADCGKTFKRADALSNHLKTHNAENIFTCPVQGCGNQYTTKAALKYHVLKHQGLKKFTCRIPGCNRAFITLAQLKQHERAAFYHQKAGNINMELLNKEGEHEEEEVPLKEGQVQVKEESLGSETQSSTHGSESYKLLKVEADAGKVSNGVNTTFTGLNQVNMAQNLAWESAQQNIVVGPVTEEFKFNDMVRSLIEENKLLKSRLNDMMSVASNSLTGNMNTMQNAMPNAMPVNMNQFGLIPNGFNGMNGLNGLNLQRLAALQYNFSM